MRLSSALAVALGVPSALAQTAGTFDIVGNTLASAMMVRFKVFSLLPSLNNLFLDVRG
jgi:hypothetical protein